MKTCVQKEFVSPLIVMFMASSLALAWGGESQQSPQRDMPEKSTGGASKGAGTLWRGLHLMMPDPSRLPVVHKAISEVLAPLGVNVIVFELNYRYAWESHPELRGGNALTKSQARALAGLCKDHKIRLIPLFNCLGHQSWAKSTFALLEKHPEFDETPQLPKDNPNIYCRSWCPLHPQVNEVVFSLMDELIDAFQCDAFHVGMDEVFLIASDQCERCRGKEPAQLFAKAVNDYHQHLVKQKKLTMLMWGDRLLADSEMKYGEWESSRNKTEGAIDMIPKDIVMCDWHYEPRQEYPSVTYFQKKGFRVWPSSWRNQQAALALLEYARNNSTEKMLGHLCTTWVDAGQVARVLTGETDASLERTQDLVKAMRACLERLGNPARETK